MEEKIKAFTDLKAWQESHKLVLLIYKATKKFPKQEVFGLISQMRRAAVSVTSNISEGFGRRGYKEKVQFYYLAQGSLIELRNQIIIAKDVGYINKEEYDTLTSNMDLAHKLLQGLITKSKTFLNHKS
jgi:four helix bundle protein|tara:strand:- start:928 stop:1311 length:384 start_codon:yes stop_codon:yes gene_type:complete